MNHLHIAARVANPEHSESDDSHGVQWTLTYGEMPSEDEFMQAWDILEQSGGLRNGKFQFGNDPRVGNAEFSSYELWEELSQAHTEWESQTSDDLSETDPEETGMWISNVLSILGFEWI